MKLHGFTYKSLSHELEVHFGIIQTENNLKAKVANGNFGAQLLLMSMVVMGVDNVSSSDIKEAFNAAAKERD